MFVCSPHYTGGAYVYVRAATSRPSTLQLLLRLRLHSFLNPRRDCLIVEEPRRVARIRVILRVFRLALTIPLARGLKVPQMYLHSTRRHSARVRSHSNRYAYTVTKTPVILVCISCAVDSELEGGMKLTQAFAANLLPLITGSAA